MKPRRSKRVSSLQKVTKGLWRTEECSIQHHIPNLESSTDLAVEGSGDGHLHAMCREYRPVALQKGPVAIDLYASPRV